MGDVRTFVFYQLFNLLCRLEMIKIVHEVLDLPERAMPCLFRFGEILALRRRAVVFPLQSEVNHLVAVLLKQTASVEAHRLRSALVEVVNVNKKDFHRIVKKNKKLFVITDGFSTIRKFLYMFLSTIYTNSGILNIVSVVPIP